MIETDLNTLIDAAAQAQTPADLWQIALDFMHGRGVCMVSYHHFSTLSGVRIDIASDGFPEDWSATISGTSCTASIPSPNWPRR